MVKLMKDKLLLIIYLINKTKIFLIGINILLAYNLYANNDTLVIFEGIEEKNLLQMV